MKYKIEISNYLIPYIILHKTTLIKLLLLFLHGIQHYDEY
jgi:hypothetical protein